MTEEFNNVLKNAYRTFKNHPDPPIPLDLIRSFLENEGIPPEEYESDSKD